VQELEQLEADAKFAVERKEKTLQDLTNGLERRKAAVEQKKRDESLSAESRQEQLRQDIASLRTGLSRYDSKVMEERGKLELISKRLGEQEVLLAGLTTQIASRERELGEQRDELSRWQEQELSLIEEERRRVAQSKQQQQQKRLPQPEAASLPPKAAYDAIIDLFTGDLN